MKIRITVELNDDARRGIWWRSGPRGQRNRLATRDECHAELTSLVSEWIKDLQEEADVNDCRDEGDEDEIVAR